MNIRSFLNKITKQAKYPTKLLSLLTAPSARYFPSRPVSSIRILSRLYGVKFESLKQGNNYNLGALYTLPHPMAAKAYSILIDQNPANLGSWADTKAPITGTKKLEWEVIHQHLELYGASSQIFTGYVTSGGTEGNIMAVWMGRNFLQRSIPIGQIRVIKTSLTHYSVAKAVNLCGLKAELTPLTSEWSIDSEGLATTLENLLKQKIQGFLVSLTIGYTVTGTADNLKAVEAVIIKFQQEHPQTKFYVWVDAALNGLIEPAISNHWLKNNRIVQTVVVDYHKFGLAPYPASLLLYRQQLKKYIEQPIGYLSETDTTLSGSRSGLPAASIWAVTQALGKSGYQQLLAEQLDNKKMFETGLEVLSKNITVITGPGSITCGVMFNTLPLKRLPAWIESKYSMHAAQLKVLFQPAQRKSVVIYKVFFLPHLKPRVVKEFLQDLQTLYQ